MKKYSDLTNEEFRSIQDAYKSLCDSNKDGPSLLTLLRFSDANLTLSGSTIEDLAQDLYSKMKLFEQNEPAYRLSL